MIYFIKYFYHYTHLIYIVTNYIKEYNETGHNLSMIDDIIQNIKSCGSVAIKFCQWITPKLEVMHLDEENILKEDKPLWLKKFEGFYEDCDNHSIDYTLSHYKEVFNEDFNDSYEILDIIGSGSIGQVYLIQEKPLTHFSERKKYVMKIIHPDVKYQINFFRKYYSLVSKIPSVKNILNQKFPFDIYAFIDQFNEQSNFINESNHLLRFKEYYKDNNFIIIPELITCSETIMIMSYEEGISFDDVDINKYQKYKIATLLASFTKNNQHILNYHHGDLHKGNWKVRLCDDNNHKLVVYDFGFCWKVPLSKTDLINNVTELFEDSDEDLKTININDMVHILKCFLRYDETINDKINDRICSYLEANINNIKPWNLNPSRLFKMTVDLCISEDLLINPIMIQAIIILIQCQKIFEEFRITSTDKDVINSYEVYRSRYLDLITFYKTYHIFNELSDFITDILDKKQIEVDTIFDCVEMPDSIKELALKHN